MNDHKDIALVIDMRSKADFAKCSLDKSINFPPEILNEEMFFNWKKESALIEKDPNICRTDKQKKQLSARRRHWVFIIIAQHSDTLKKTLMKLHTLGNKEALAALVSEMKTEQEKLDLVTILNGFMCF